MAAKDFGREGFPRDFCPGSNFARGFHGRSGVYVDRVGLICHTGGTPNLQAAPDAIIAVNLIDPQTGPITTVPTPFVLFQWTDHSTAETGFRIRINALSGGFQRSIDRPAAPGVGSRQAVTISDLPFVGYGVKVCATFQGSAELCNPLALLVFGIGPGLGSPTDVFFERAGTGQATAHWTHNFSNPTQFDVRLHCDSPLALKKVSRPPLMAELGRETSTSSVSDLGHSGFVHSIHRNHRLVSAPPLFRFRASSTSITGGCSAAQIAW